MMYKDDIEKEIKSLESEIKGLEKRYNATKQITCSELINLRKRQLEAFRNILPKAPEKIYASQYVLWRELRYQPKPGENYV